MHKKLILAFVALAVFITSPAALASPVLTSSPGVKVPVGEEIKWTNTGDYLGTGLEGNPSWKCTGVDLQFKLTENSGVSIRGEAAAGSAKLTGTGAGGDCTSAAGNVAWTFNSALCFSTVAKDQIQVTGCSGSIFYTLDTTGVGSCKYSMASMTGTFPTVFQDATVGLPNLQGSKVEGGFFCPSKDNLDLHFDLVTSAGGTMTIA
jgi:hypothetical protein